MNVRMRYQHKNLGSTQFQVIHKNGSKPVVGIGNYHEEGSSKAMPNMKFGKGGILLR